MVDYSSPFHPCILPLTGIYLFSSVKYLFSEFTIKDLLKQKLPILQQRVHYEFNIEKS